MHKVSLVTIGKLKEMWARDAAKLYVDRVRPVLDVSITELAPSRQPNAAGQKLEESERLLVSAEKQQGKLWVLDERGAQCTSQEFADALMNCWDAGESLTFILGGSYGLTDQVRHKADKVIALSAMTLPHELCRVVFLEQLYRATEIAKGSGYHH